MQTAVTVTCSNMTVTMEAEAENVMVAATSYLMFKIGNVSLVIHKKTTKV